MSRHRVDSDICCVKPFSSYTCVTLKVFYILRLAKKWADSEAKAGLEMNIDASYEFASFVKSSGVELTTEPVFCVKDEDQCAILYSPPATCVSSCSLGHYLSLDYD